MLIFKNQNKAAATATTGLGASAKSTAKDMGRLGFTLDYIRGIKIAEYMAETEKETKKVATGTGSAADKAKELADKTTEAAKALREYMGAALDDAKSKLDKAQSAFDSFSGSVAQVITEALNFGKAFEEGGEDAGTTFFSALQKQADKTKEFGDLVEQLLAAGLSQDALQQVIDAGIDSGSAIAKELLTSSENVLRANTLVEQTQAIAQRIGELSAQKFYGAGVSNAKAYLRGVEEALAAAEGRLSRKGINFADVKGISTSFTEAISAPSVSPVVMPNIDELNSRRGGGAVTINVNSQLATKSEIGRAVTDGMRAYNRAAGPANFDVWNS